MTDEETIADLAARFEQFYPVVTGMTLGMMLANIPALILGDPLAGKLPVKASASSLLSCLPSIGMLTLLGVGR
jgi:putative Ca2+/H+ antiporter (TMEM165/GDT1 family)